MDRLTRLVWLWQAQALTCSIFYTLMAKFRYSLKAEVGLFFPMMLLRAIEPAAVGTKPNMAGTWHAFQSLAKSDLGGPALCTSSWRRAQSQHS